MALARHANRVRGSPRSYPSGDDDDTDDADEEDDDRNTDDGEYMDECGSDSDCHIPPDGRKLIYHKTAGN